MDVLEIEKRLGNHDTIVFEVFDTLLVRLYAESSDLLYHLEETNHMPGFQATHAAAEQAAVQNAKQPVFLQDIYNELHQSYAPMMEMETALAKATYRANPQMKKLYVAAVQSGKKIVLFAHSVFPTKTVEEILLCCGYDGYEKLYVFSSQNQFLSAGKCLEDMQQGGTNSNGIIYIGNFFSQYENVLPCKAMVEMCDYEPIYKTYGSSEHSAYFSILNRYAKNTCAASMLEGLITLYTVENGENYWKQFGYQYVGPVVYGFLEWVKKRMDFCCIKKVFFTTATGAILRKAFEKMYPDSELSELQSIETFSQIDAESEQKYWTYLNASGVNDKEAAVVQPFWNHEVCSFEQLLLQSKTEVPKFIGYGIDQVLPASAKLRVDTLLGDHTALPRGQSAEWLKNHYVISILTYVFSPLNNSTQKAIYNGVIDFISEWSDLASQTAVNFSKDLFLAPLEYWACSISRKDQFYLEQVSNNFDKEHPNRPLFQQPRPAFGVINPWPGGKSAEAEVLARLRRAAEENDITCVFLDNFGHILDHDQQATKKYVNSKDLSFVMTTHYETPKILDAFHYHTLWNPPEIPMNLEYYTERVTNQYIMNDDFLIYDSGGMSNHLKSMLMNCPRNVDHASSLTASFPKSALLPPRLDSPTMFYCGMNWEKVVHGSNRHEGLFKLLDATGNVKFFGPDRVAEWGGLRPWEGYKCYQYPIPFDGFSILKEINACGVCLVLSSDIHRRAGAVTNRAYEACAAGAVMISDDNDFMLEHFSDAALFITYNKNNPHDTFRQIMEKFNWILEHPQEARKLVERAQEIFLEKFSLDVQLDKIVSSHAQRHQQIAADLYAKDSSQRVLVTYVLNTQDQDEAKERLSSVFDNIHNQLYSNIILAIAADDKISDGVRQYAREQCACAVVHTIPLFDAKGVRKLTDGQAIRMLQKETPHRYYINTTSDETWFYDHITTLVRKLEDTGLYCAYSGAAEEDIYQYRRVVFFDSLGSKQLFYMTQPTSMLQAGQFLFDCHAHEFVPDFLFDSLDGTEHYVYANLLHYKHEQKLAFTKRMTFVTTQDSKDERMNVLQIDMQKRFIQDLVRFELPEQTAALTADGEEGIPVNSTAVGDMILKIPLRYWIWLRWYRFCMRKVRLGSERYQTIEKKHNALLDVYQRYWRN